LFVALEENRNIYDSDILKSSIIWDMTPPSQLKENKQFEGMYPNCFHSGFLLGLFFLTEEQCDILLRNIDLIPTEYRVLYAITIGARASFQITGNVFVADFVVGAPHEEAGTGVIYIYHGGKGGPRGKASQRITGSEVRRDILGFGISFSRSLDIDGNHYPGRSKP
jgi:hypothetical protein